MDNAYWEQFESVETTSGNEDYFSQFEEVKEAPQQRSTIAKAGRIGTQLALGTAEKIAMPYELAVAPLQSQEAQLPEYRKSLLSDIQSLQDEKQFGQFTPEKQQELEAKIDELRNPRKSLESIKPTDLSIRGFAEKATGADLKPEGTLEKAANWLGFIKKPSNILALRKTGANPKELIKSILPSGTEGMRSLGAGFALEAAEKGEFGPVGTLAATITGDLIGGGTAKLGKAAMNPKQAIANVTASLVNKSKKATQQQLIRDMRDAGIQADVGTITDSNLLKLIQTKLSQSGLTGKPLEKFKTNLLNDVKKEYTQMADRLGNSRFDTLREASEVGKGYLTANRDAEKKVLDELYTKARMALKPNEKTSAVEIKKVVNEILTDLKPGAVKSTEQKAVIKVLNEVTKDIKNGSADVAGLLNTKSALSDLINFEVQGGQKKLLKRVAFEIDKALQSHSQGNQSFGALYRKANSNFKRHAEKFRNDVINPILIKDNPELLMQKMNSIEGMRKVEKAMSQTPQGRRAFKDMQRFKLDQIIGNKMTDNVNSQLKIGTFSNLLKNPKDRQLVKEMLGTQSFDRLERLQKATGVLAESANKFFNSSKSGVHATDFAILYGTMKSLGHTLSGNPWGLVKPIAGFLTQRQVTKLMADPKFLRMVEDVVLATKKGDTNHMLELGRKMLPAINAVRNQKDDKDDPK